MVATDNSPTLGCLGLAPSRLSKQWGIDILPIFLLRLGSKPSDVDHLLGLSGDLRFYISVPYFPGLSESFKKIFKYTPVQVCFKGVNTLKSMLMHPKDKVPNDQKKDLVYHWKCKADGCKSSYIGETSRALGERVKEHSKLTTSAILKHCKDFHHPLPLHQ